MKAVCIYVGDGQTYLLLALYFCSSAEADMCETRALLISAIIGKCQWLQEAQKY